MQSGAEASARAAFDWDTARDHCRMSWLRGRFLARGSLSLAEGHTHLEFVVPPDEAPILAERLAQVGLPASRRLRRGRGVVTWKGTEQVLVFLRRVGASATVLEIEARLVARQLRGHLNRVVNAEEGNIVRSVRAATRQLRAIDALEAADGLSGLSPADRSIAEARRTAPEATLADLAGGPADESRARPAGVVAHRGRGRAADVSGAEASEPRSLGRQPSTLRGAHEWSQFRSSGRWQALPGPAEAAAVDFARRA